MNVKSTDKYLGMISSLEENFKEFKSLKEELTKVFSYTIVPNVVLPGLIVQIQQELHALEALDEVSNEELQELSEVPSKSLSPSMQKRQSRLQTGPGGDVITEMLGLMRKSPIQTAQARSIHHMITQLVQREPSDTLRRPSLLVHPTPSELNARRTSQYVDSSIPHEPSSTTHNIRPTAPQHSLFERAASASTSRRPFSTVTDQHMLSRRHFTRRHTLSTVPESTHLQRSTESKEL